MLLLLLLDAPCLPFLLVLLLRPTLPLLPCLQLLLRPPRLPLPCLLRLLFLFWLFLKHYVAPAASSATSASALSAALFAVNARSVSQGTLARQPTKLNKSTQKAEHGPRRESWNELPVHWRPFKEAYLCVMVRAPAGCHMVILFHKAQLDAPNAPCWLIPHVLCSLGARQLRPEL